MGSEYCVRDKFKILKSPLIRAFGWGRGLIFGLGKDITGTKKSEAALRKACHQLRTLVRERTLALVKANRPLRQILKNQRQTQKALLERTCRLQIAYDQALAYAGALNEEITERKRVAEELRSKEALIKATLESTANGILVVNNAGEVTHKNRLFAEICGMPDEIADGKNSDGVLNYLFNQTGGSGSHLSNANQLDEGPEAGFETLHLRDGRIIEGFSCPLTHNGSADGRVWSFRDVTERHIAEQEHARMRKLEGVLEMAGAVCHEVNQPLQVLSASADRILDLRTLDDSSYNQVKRMAKSVETIAVITRKLQNITRYETKEYCSGIRIVDIDRASRLK